MTQPRQGASPHAIHVGASAASARGMEEEAQRKGASVLRVSLRGVEDRQQLGERLAESFLFPHRTVGLDAAIDLISDLEWFGNRQGYLVVINAEEAAMSVLIDMATILPAIVDRWRSQWVPFAVVIVGDSEKSTLLEALEQENASMDEHRRLPWGNLIPAESGSLIKVTQRCMLNLKCAHGWTRHPIVDALRGIQS